ncbi:hypothetical protein HGRIS_003528 [Hohenbuehelia grisea]|uniref:Thioesterase domain-containing protein n=1 Tax=Hohenbuehelia grisea TaxID=104357 RepID=A0ABR3JGM4_9AGAR
MPRGPPSANPNAFIAALPDAPGLDASLIKGNVPQDQKRLSANALAFFVDSQGKSYNAGVGKRIKLVEINTRKRRGEAGKETDEMETVCEIVVEPDMCNVYGVLHGGCAAYIIDPCTSSALVGLGLYLGVDGTGMSNSMQIIWHAAAPLGAKLRIVNTSLSIKGRVRSARCEIWNTRTGELCISGVHSTVNASKKLPSAKL